MGGSCIRQVWLCLLCSLLPVLLPSITISLNVFTTSFSSAIQLMVPQTPHPYMAAFLVQDFGRKHADSVCVSPLILLSFYIHGLSSTCLSLFPLLPSLAWRAHQHVPPLPPTTLPALPTTCLAAGWFSGPSLPHVVYSGRRMVSLSVPYLTLQTWLCMPLLTPSLP